MQWDVENRVLVIVFLRVCGGGGVGIRHPCEKNEPTLDYFGGYWMVHGKACWVIDYNKILGYEPADLTVHPPPQNDQGWVHFFAWVSSVTKIFS